MNKVQRSRSRLMVTPPGYNVTSIMLIHYNVSTCELLTSYTILLVHLQSLNDAVINYSKMTCTGLGFQSSFFIPLEQTPCFFLVLVGSPLSIISNIRHVKTNRHINKFLLPVIFWPRMRLTNRDLF